MQSILSATLLLLLLESISTTATTGVDLRGLRALGSTNGKRAMGGFTGGDMRYHPHRYLPVLGNETTTEVLAATNSSSTSDDSSDSSDDSTNTSSTSDDSSDRSMASQSVNSEGTKTAIGLTVGAGALAAMMAALLFVSKYKKSVATTAVPIKVLDLPGDDEEDIEDATVISVATAE